jgi:hypothetical protein
MIDEWRCQKNNTSLTAKGKFIDDIIQSLVIYCKFCGVLV